MKVEIVPLQWLPRVWPHVVGFVKSALEEAHADMDVQQAQVHAFSGRYLTFLAVDGEEIKGAALIEVYNDAPHRVAYIISIGGLLITSQDTFNDFQAMLAAEGATVIRGAVRQSVARMSRQYGFTEKQILVEKII